MFLVGSGAGDVDRLYMVATRKKQCCIYKDCLRMKSSPWVPWPFGRSQRDTS